VNRVAKVLRPAPAEEVAEALHCRGGAACPERAGDALAHSRRRTTAPEIGAHTDEALNDLGYTTAEIEKLRADGAV
jgi:crotonobetainyl-CoA:carnitine CoA-transferase CaiB-like acyl-CoA transferase